MWDGAGPPLLRFSFCGKWVNFVRTAICQITVKMSWPYLTGSHASVQEIQKGRKVQIAASDRVLPNTDKMLHGNAQGIREQLAEMRAELDDLKGASAPAAGPATTGYMGIAPSPAELEFKLIRLVNLQVLQLPRKKSPMHRQLMLLQFPKGCA